MGTCHRPSDIHRGSTGRNRDLNSKKLTFVMEHAIKLYLREMEVSVRQTFLNWKARRSIHKMKL